MIGEITSMASTLTGFRELPYLALAHSPYRKGMTLACRTAPLSFSPMCQGALHETEFREHVQDKQILWGKGLRSLEPLNFC
jgi:hypothetical protein